MFSILYLVAKYQKSASIATNRSRRVTADSYSMPNYIFIFLFFRNALPPVAGMSLYSNWLQGNSLLPPYAAKSLYKPRS